MTTVIAVLLIWAIIAIPFSCLAYGIFLIRENKTARYPAIYKRAAIFFGIFLVIMGAYIFGPVFFARMERPADIVLEGRYFDPNNNDTLTFTNGQVMVRNVARPDNNLTGTFVLNQPQKSGFFDDLGHVYFGGSSDYNKHILQIYYMDSSNVKAAEKKNAKSKRKGYLPSPVSKENEYRVRISGGDLVLMNRYSLGERRYIKLKN